VAGICNKEDSPAKRIAAAMGHAKALDDAIAATSTRESEYGHLAPLAALLGALLLSGLLLAPHAAPKRLIWAGVLVTTMVVGQAFWNWQMERFSDAMHVGLYIAITVVLDLTLVYAILRSQKAAEWLDKNILIGALLFPGILIVSYTRTTWPQSYIMASAMVLFAATIGVPRMGGASLFRPSQWQRGIVGVGIAAVLMALLYRVGFKAQNHLPEFIRNDDLLRPALALACIPIFAFFRHRSDDRATLATTAVAAGLALASLWFRRSAPVEVCLLGWGGLAAAAIVVITRRGPQATAELLLLGSWAWVSRDNEVWVVVVTYLLAARVARGIRDSLDHDGSTGVRPSVVLFCVTFLFTFCFIQRVGVQLGLDFMYFDWGAGAFRDPNVSMLRIGVAISYKHLLPRAAIVFVILAALPAAYRLWTIRALFVAEAVRASALATMLYVSRHSFWTSMRVMGDTPHALIAVLVAAIGYLIVCARSESTQSEPVPPPLVPNPASAD
jgi:hypothetical protein